MNRDDENKKKMASAKRAGELYSGENHAASKTIDGLHCTCIEHAL